MSISTICIVLLAFVAANALGRSTNVLGHGTTNTERLINAHLGDGLSDRSLNSRLDQTSSGLAKAKAACMDKSKATYDKASFEWNELRNEAHEFLDRATASADNDHGYCSVEPYCDEKGKQYVAWVAKTVANFVTFAKAGFKKDQGKDTDHQTETVFDNAVMNWSSCIGGGLEDGRTARACDRLPEAMSQQAEEIAAALAAMTPEARAAALEAMSPTERATALAARSVGPILMIRTGIKFLKLDDVDGRLVKKYETFVAASKYFCNFLQKKFKAFNNFMRKSKAEARICKGIV